MAKILGLDLGTNSIGWAVVEKEGDGFSLLNKGVRIFQEGVKIEKGVESSKAAERTGFRAARRLKYRRKLRKIAALKVLIEYGFCPFLSDKEMDDWRYKKVYPIKKDFFDWWKTSEENNKNPYYYRNVAVTKKMNLENEEDRFLLGRVFYHITQRRGFLSNRLEGTKESDGAVKKEIEFITEEKGEMTLGQYFYEKFKKGEKIRNHYTHREKHYLEEFNKICQFQELPDDFVEKLKRAIFFQRPLKSQKGLIGKCVFEQKSQRCSVSHPLYEEYRMLCFVNNIRIKTPYDEKLRPLNDEERKIAVNRFFLKRPHFNFEDIAKQLAPKNQYKYFKDYSIKHEDFLFNFKMDATVSGNPVSSCFKELFGDDFLNLKIEYKRERDGKISFIDINDVWHVLYTFDNEQKLEDFARKRLKLDDEQTKKFVKIELKKEFASLSLKAIRKILPFLREGLIYSHAVLMANLPDIVEEGIWNNIEKRNTIKSKVFEIIKTQNDEKAIIEIVNGFIKNIRETGECWSDTAEEYFYNDLKKKIISHFGKNTYALFDFEKRTRIEEEAFTLLKKQMIANSFKGDFIKVQTVDERLKNYLKNNFGIYKDEINIYHPSAIETYKDAKRANDGKKYLGSPLVSSVRNPMAMRALHQLRLVINELIKNDIIDDNTKINIETSRGLLNANERIGLQSWQRERENKRKEYAEKIAAHYKEQGYNTTPSNDDILKYQLWEEQNHKCIYTGKEIALSEFLGANPSFDIEHTIPRSISFDNSQENKTLCDSRFNRDVKGNKIPFELSNYEEIKERVKDWDKKYIEPLNKQIELAVKQARGAADKNTKDNAIRKRHKLTFERNYWRNKYNRFMMQDVPEGFKNSQLVDTGIITKYSCLYLKSAFDKVYTVKGSVVADFRKMWGLQNIYEKKERINHVHHCIDAIVIACISKENYEMLAKYYHENDDAFKRFTDKNLYIKKPWVNFTEDILAVENEIFVSHHTPDVIKKQSRKILRKQGKKVKDKNGQFIYQQGDTVRGSLHKETFYGAIERTELNKKGEEEKVIKYVVRKPLESVEDANLKSIVDDKVREVVIEARKTEKILKNEIESCEKELKKAEEHEEQAIKDKIFELKRQITALYVLPNKNGAPIPIKKVRMYQPTVTNPLYLKKHRDKSLKNPKPHKEQYHVANDSNYMMAIYEGVDAKGNIKRDFEIRNYLEAGEYFKLSTKKMLKQQEITGYKGLIPESKTFGNIELPLKAIIKIGTMVILWEKTPDEVWDIGVEEKRKRLYKVVGLSNQRIKSNTGKFNEYATIVLKYNQEASSASELKTQDGVFEAKEQYKAQRKLNHNQFNALIEGYDFKLTTLGKIVPKK